MRSEEPDAPKRCIWLRRTVVSRATSSVPASNSRATNWAGKVAAVLLAVACIVSAVSGFFDGGLAAQGMSRAQVAFQIVLISWTAFVGALAVARLRRQLSGA